ncbi:hypothetical protein Tco_1153170 [Tanacetum coccineum]
MEWESTSFRVLDWENIWTSMWSSFFKGCNIAHSYDVLKMGIFSFLKLLQNTQESMKCFEAAMKCLEASSCLLEVTTAKLKEFDLLKWDPIRGILQLGKQVVSELVALRNFARRYGSRFCTHSGCIQSSNAQTGNAFLQLAVEIAQKIRVKARKKRFGGNAATRKTQWNLLKQQYENFTTPSLEMLDQTFDRLQKLVSQLELLGEMISQEDVNRSY